LACVPDAPDFRRARVVLEILGRPMDAAGSRTFHYGLSMSVLRTASESGTRVLQRLRQAAVGARRGYRSLDAPLEYDVTQWLTPSDDTVVPFPIAAGRHADDLVARAEGRTWFHTFTFDGGVRIEGYDPTGRKANLFGLPPSLEGKRVLDVGTYDGYFAFEAARRGADDVLATDRFAWTWPGSDAKGNFEIIRDFTGLPVRDLTIAVEDITPDAVGGVYDVVLFYGVLYHAADPLRYLQAIRHVTGEYALIETVVDLLDVDRAAAAYYPGTFLNGDASNKFGPNHAAVEGWCLDVGFSRVEHLANWSPHIVFDLAGVPYDITLPPTSGRAVYRAWA
jgi:tRNA (mo5U34)-methyltransferase